MKTITINTYFIQGKGSLFNLQSYNVYYNTLVGHLTDFLVFPNLWVVHFGILPKMYRKNDSQIF